MTNNELPQIGPEITAAAAQVIDTTVTLAGGIDLSSMRDYARDLAAQAAHLAELLDIETQGGQGALEDGYAPADRRSVIASIRRHFARAFADRLTWRDNDGGLHLLWGA